MLFFGFVQDPHRMPPRLGLHRGRGRQRLGRIGGVRAATGTDGGLRGVGRRAVGRGRDGDGRGLDGRGLDGRGLDGRCQDELDGRRGGRRRRIRECVSCSHC
ncbi:hypothetical protein FRACA_2120005 [Frankia canadensis]|uniref:Uncharacterized protein n=1 Tax=Frankia canadensis TaxID=1836972 RepID=A0A2I2KQP2_9ACTN|nr:hypothetical protein FRACA_2120005 [Frankia canadensis]SOU55274.1 hypothetical protein FRACA_2120005 [Frankia canadensis]